MADIYSSAFTCSRTIVVECPYLDAKTTTTNIVHGFRTSSVKSNKITFKCRPLMQASVEDRSLTIDVVSEKDLREKGFSGFRKTKLVCTIGPACSSSEDLEKLASGGMNVARLNMCHNTKEWHKDVIKKIKHLNEERGFCVSIMIDTQGTQHVVDHGFPTSIKAENESIWSFTAKQFDGYRPLTLRANYEQFSQGIKVGDEIVVDGGMASFVVLEKIENDLVCRCTDPGLILPRAKLSIWRNGRIVEENHDLPALTAKDWSDIEFGISEGVDFIAMSFVKDAYPIKHLKNYLSTNALKRVDVLAKIENLESIQKLEEIVEACEGIMIARGDLGVEIPLEYIPTVQDEIIKVCRQLNKPVIVASQLLESMVEYPTPTRAEVADVSEAVQQNADALMLSGESAIGAFGHKALSVLRMSSSRMELWSREEKQRYLIHQSQSIAEEICYSAVQLANNLSVDAIFVYTKYGQMASLLSRNRPNPPIFAFTDDDSVRMSLNLQWGVLPVLADLSDDMDVNVAKTMDHIKRKGMMKRGDTILVVSDTCANISSSVFQSIQVKSI